MKATKLATVLITATLSLTAISSAANAQGKTREQVRQELIQAQHDGTIQPSKTQYPPNADAVARSRQLHAITKHAGETSPGTDHHDAIAAR